MIDPRQHRIDDLISWWPTLDEAHGCLDCSKLFRAKNGHCPFCQSAAIINLAEVLRRGEEWEPRPWSAAERVRRRLADGTISE